MYSGEDNKVYLEKLNLAAVTIGYKRNIAMNTSAGITNRNPCRFFHLVYPILFPRYCIRISQQS